MYLVHNLLMIKIALLFLFYTDNSKWYIAHFDFKKTYQSTFSDGKKAFLNFSTSCFA